jgi:dephospho-CoA kinase
VSTGRSRTPSKRGLHAPGRSGKRDFLLVGVTGGIGSGKTSVCRAFQNLGRTVISADAVGRELTESDPEIRKKISVSFGSEMFTSAGVLDRRALADVVFRNPQARDMLNGIIHPAVFRRMEQILASLPVELRRPYTIEEAALVFESGRDRDLDYVIVVDAPEETRIARVMARDGVGREDVLLRVRSQMPTHEKLRKADITIENSGTEEELAEKVAFFDRLLRSMSP